MQKYKKTQEFTMELLDCVNENRWKQYVPCAGDGSCWVCAADDEYSERKS